MRSRNIRLRRFVYRSSRLNGERRMSRRHCISIYVCCSINFRICGAGIAPAWRAISRPFRNNVIVGNAETRKRYPRVGTSSVFTVATSRRPAVSLATLRTSGATILQGPKAPKIHQHRHSRVTYQCLKSEVIVDVDRFTNRLEFALTLAASENLAQTFVSHPVTAPAFWTIQ